MIVKLVPDDEHSISFLCYYRFQTLEMYGSCLLCLLLDLVKKLEKNKIFSGALRKINSVLFQILKSNMQILCTINK